MITRNNNIIKTYDFQFLIYVRYPEKSMFYFTFLQDNHFR